MLQPIKNLKRAPAEQVVVFAVVLGLILLAIWASIILFIWVVITLLGGQADLFGMFEGLSSAAALALAVGGGLVALVQINESIDTRNIAVFNDAFNRLMSDEEIEARRYIYQELPDDPSVGMAQLSGVGQAHVKRVLNSFDYLGFLIDQGWVSNEARDSIIGWMSPIVMKVWQKLGRYVMNERDRRDDPYYYISASKLADHCHEWMQENRPDMEYKMIKDAL